MLRLLQICFRKEKCSFTKCIICNRRKRCCTCYKLKIELKQKCNWKCNNHFSYLSILFLSVYFNFSTSCYKVTF